MLSTRYARNLTLREIFDDRISPNPNTGCWIWIGSLHYDRNGNPDYGVIPRRRKLLYAHRVAWELFRGSIPKGLHILHKCDNPPCVNPDHLFLGTHLDNMRDCNSKGRRNTPRGQDHPSAKLDDAAVRDIKAGRMRSCYYARIYNVSPQLICDIVKGRIWAQIEGDGEAVAGTN